MKQQIDPYLSFTGDATEAVAYYEKIFETENNFIMKYDEMPDFCI